METKQVTKRDRPLLTVTVNKEVLEWCKVEAEKRRMTLSRFVNDVLVQAIANNITGDDK